MEIYVVRIYKREHAESTHKETIFGVVEEVSTNSSWKFKSPDELLKIICPIPEITTPKMKSGETPMNDNLG